MKKTGTLFVIGAASYILLELMWRGHSHWSMAIAGGISLAALFGVFGKLKTAPVYFKALLGGIIITLIEFIFGAIFNIWLGMEVWDYSEVEGNILGQICPLYTLLWCAVCVPISLTEKMLRYRGTEFDKSV